MNITSQVTLDSVTRKRDKSISLRFVTTLEQSSEQLMEMDKLLNDTGVLYFKSSGKLTEDEKNALENVKIENEGKSKSQRLRAVMWVYYKQNEEEIGKDFKDFYSDKMEGFIEHIKGKIKQD